MLRAFKTKQVPSPKFWEYTEFDSITQFPVVVRARKHFKGQAFFVVNSRAELQRYKTSNYYAMERINIQDEYRIFVCSGKVFEINKKIKDPTRRDTLNPIIRNYENGWIMRRGGWGEAPRNVRPAAVAAAAATGLDFGAADVYVDTQGRVGVFEINSAPGLVQRKIDKLAIKILKKFKLISEAYTLPV
jgi:glutathione synthase/RimK-type ligase-like ATP-grasp enzyme